MAKRVVITGMGSVSPLGSSLEEVFASLKAGENFVVYMKEWDKYKGLHTRLASPIIGFKVPEHYGRKQTRSMGRTAMLAVRSTELALEDAGLLGSKELENGCCGVAYGSSSGSIDAIYDFYSVIKSNEVTGVTSSTYIKMMSHTSPVNISVFFKLKGRLIPTGTACTSGSLGVGYAYEAIKYGHQLIMLAGGSEELDPTQSVVFDTLFATSTMNDSPKSTPRPYDKDRDGLVIGEGAGTLVLEEYEHAKARGAKIYAEIVGFGTNTDGAHITQPESETMAVALKLSLECAEISPDAIGYVNGHGTATKQGDEAETKAVRSIFKRSVPISSQKSYIGHSLGACGAIEAITSVIMLNRSWFAPTLNLENIDPACADLDYITGAGSLIDTEYCMSNNFAFGGINTSLIFKKM
jgi:3-oxoacyl-[acyl-carrier-protein] synthase II